MDCDARPLAPGMLGDSPFAADFIAAGKRAPSGQSLRDVDGQTRLLRYRCSYMIYSPAFTGLPTPLRNRVLRDLAAALEGGTAGSHLADDERSAIRQILTGTLPEFRAALSDDAAPLPGTMR